LTTGAGGRDAPRTDTPNHLKTTNKLGVALLREQLSELDRALLHLRVDRGLSFREVAQALADEGQTLDEAQLHQQAARFRKRYQVTKDRLRVLAIEAGLLRSR
jgi:RNA polymerase sigma-70 factor (ECF subfamily)